MHLNLNKYILNINMYIYMCVCMFLASSTPQQHPEAAPAGQLENSNATLTAAPSSSTLKQHPAAALCSSTNMPAPKHTFSTHPILEVRTPIASLSGE